jgi:hypothetical protein
MTCRNSAAEMKPLPSLSNTWAQQPFHRTAVLAASIATRQPRAHTPRRESPQPPRLTLKASRISSSESVSFILRAMSVKNSGKSMVPLPSASTWSARRDTTMAREMYARACRSRCTRAPAEAAQQGAPRRGWSAWGDAPQSDRAPYLVDHVLKLSLGRVLAERAHDSAQLLRGDGAVTILVEQGEGLLELGNLLLCSDTPQFSTRSSYCSSRPVACVSSPPDFESGAHRRITSPPPPARRRGGVGRRRPAPQTLSARSCARPALLPPAPARPYQSAGRPFQRAVMVMVPRLPVCV